MGSTAACGEHWEQVKLSRMPPHVDPTPHAVCSQAVVAAVARAVALVRICGDGGDGALVGGGGGLAAGGLNSS